MIVTKFELFFLPPRWVFLKIETDEGISGWGEPVLEGRAHTVAAAVDEQSSTTQSIALSTENMRSASQEDISKIDSISLEADNIKRSTQCLEKGIESFK